MKLRFLRQDSVNISKLEKKWRRPRGKHSKIRLSRNGHGFMPKVGYASKKEERHYIEGLKPARIYNLKSLESLDSNLNIGLISASLGLKKKVEIVKAAKEKGIKLLNIKNPELFVKEVEEKIREKKKAKIKEEERSGEKPEEREEKSADKKETIEDRTEKEKEEKRKVLEKGL